MPQWLDSRVGRMHFNGSKKRREFWMLGFVNPGLVLVLSETVLVIELGQR